MRGTYHKNVLFAGGNAGIEGAEFVILGVPYDRSSSFRTGQRFGPNAMRESSWNFEPFMFEHNIDLKEVKIHDMGNLDDYGDAESMIDSVQGDVRSIFRQGSVPLVLGGEHSVSVGAVRALDRPSELPPAAKEALFGRKEIPESEKVGVIVIDAHFDMRDQYLDDRYSHACASRRFSEVVGAENIVVIGVRSISKDEHEDAARLGVNFIPSFEVKRDGIDVCLKRATNIIKPEKVYLSIDLDGMDPAYAPGVSTPEPFGITPDDVKHIIAAFGDRIIGADVVELTPPCDHSGVTSALASRLVREIIAVVHKNRARETTPSAAQQTIKPE